MSNPAPPQTTLFPLAQLPACASKCGPLYDANGGCVPPAQPKVDNACFCDHSKLIPFKTGTTGVCDAVCTNPADLTAIQKWYTDFCSGSGAAVTTGPNGATQTAKSENNGGGGGTWLSNHYQWVIFLVIMVVAITGIWVGACIWRRRYLRKKDRQYALGRNLAHATESGRVVPNASNAGTIHVPSAGLFEPAPLHAARVYDNTEKPKKEKKKWVVKERT
ncbi:hypothetical protein QBC37DRAFT_36086 [Rhypophila decipiens]|uniref:Integral membrane protein n=1 Tax=Rhypophila decipiens TaxID=261697 RepID=A0AAN7B4T7_9PEZI|nr:hypothetical protein QBC37DRAFT_36086 [Rhypophila decipiens]